MLQSVKKIEIIVCSLEVNSVLKILKRNSVEHYTLINNVSGNGQHGYTGDNSIDNSYLIVILEDIALTEKLATAMKPLLEKLGGIFIVSDAQWIAH